MVSPDKKMSSVSQNFSTINFKILMSKLLGYEFFQKTRHLNVKNVKIEPDIINICYQGHSMQIPFPLESLKCPVSKLIISTIQPIPKQPAVSKYKIPVPDFPT